ncbi:cellulase family glycosylhydrolase [Plebeiibacterium marinum]|uniref:Cellulase family glycosylhydrolase n=1 Tax=Plebeiibacterium marinum TaxID=2992111 RepID=A0AAE3SKC5_9BACT|nr:cellulase family glycosylhydrolase [Plebeiobacterium marinum]MCW3806363.1 cellulase family glycosylhydrolase [Plebeiobacterium marinum]
MKSIKHIIVILWVIAGCTACSSSEGASKPAPVFKSSIPANNDHNVNLSSIIEIVFDEVVSLAPDHGITVNNTPASVESRFTKLIFNINLEYNTNYTIVIPKGGVINTFNVPLEEAVEISFTTKTAPLINEQAMEFVSNMGVGWNLGNTLDAKGDDETAWGNPKATKELIDAICLKGFKTLRIPVTWQYHMGSEPDYLIESEWLDRVEEVVNYALDNNMYAIVNIHHDEEWIIPSYEKLNLVKGQLGKVWTQIATRFKDYDEHLIFESLNEPRLIGSSAEWTGGTAEGRDCINQFHQANVEAIRATGGNNQERYIMVSPYAASSAQVAIDGLELPSSSNLIVSVHNYYPYNFALASNDYVTEWGTEEEKQAMDAELDRVYQKFIANGVAVVMGEWGSLHHNNLDDRVQHAGYFASGCVSRGICPVWWDNGNSGEFGIINRNDYIWIFPDIAEAIVAAIKE